MERMGVVYRYRGPANLTWPCPHCREATSRFYGCDGVCLDCYTAEHPDAHTDADSVIAAIRAEHAHLWPDEDTAG